MKIVDLVLFFGGIVLGNEKGREWCLNNLKQASIIIDSKIKELPLEKTIGAVKINGTSKSASGCAGDIDCIPISKASKQSEDIARNAEGFQRNSRIDTKSDSIS